MTEPLSPLRMKRSGGRRLKSGGRVLKKKTNSFYLSSAWRGLIAEIKAERGCWCEDCGRGGKGVRLFGDHVVELKDGGAALDKANVRLLCGSCHSRKTAAARRERHGLA